MNSEFDIELPYGFTTMYRYNSSESNYPNYSDFAYNDKILMGAVLFKPTIDLIYAELFKPTNALIYADVILRPHNYFYLVIGGRGGRYSLNHSQLDKCVITKVIASLIPYTSVDNINIVLNALAPVADNYGEAIAIGLHRKEELGLYSNDNQNSLLL